MAHADQELFGLYRKWHELEYQASVSDEEAHREALKAASLLFASCRTETLEGIALKLSVACEFDEMVQKAIDQNRSCFAPRLIVAALNDLQRLTVHRLAAAE